MNDDIKKRKWFFSRPKKEKQPDTRLVRDGSGWGSWQEWVNIILLFVTLEVAVLSVEQAHWITPQPSLTFVLILAVALTLTLIKLKIHVVFKHIIVVVIGLLITMWQTLNCIEPSDTISKLSHLINVFQTWWQGSTFSLASDDKLIFIVFITFLTWLVGYLSVWFVLRRHNAWVAVVLGALVVLFNLNNLPDSYYIYFILYFFTAILLIAVTRMMVRVSGAARTINYSGGSFVYLGVSLLCIIAIAATFSWIMPQARATALQDFLATSMPWQKDILESKINIFNVVPSKQGLNSASILKDLAFGEAWNQGDEIKFFVVSERPAYWRMIAYDTYTSQGWTSNSTDKVQLGVSVLWSDNTTPVNQSTMKYTVVTGVQTDVLFTNGGFISTDIPVRLNFGAGKDILTITALRVLDPGERYTVESYVTTAEETVLSEAGVNYPDAIAKAYLQLPANFPDDVKILSENITANATTPYTKIKAILGYLAQFPYKLEVSLPPEGVDDVEYFLFTEKSGFCLYFASAAVTMLRSVGVPSRLAVGYLPGEPGDKPGQYIIRDKYYHAWPQVYFPDYGWVDIEATPAGALSNVSIGTSLVSSAAIEQSPQWDVWQGASPFSIYNIGNINLGSFNPGEASATEGTSFVAKFGRSLLFIFGAALVIAILIGFVLLTRSLSFRWLWRVDRERIAYGIYLNMCRLAVMVGLEPSPQQTPLEFTAELAKIMPQQVESLNFITQIYLENRFGGREGKLDIAEEAEILKARRIVYTKLIERFGKLRRLFVLGGRKAE
jgi:transglutaminase-like putative cysteine protease